MKRSRFFLFALLLVLTLSACAAEFDGSRTGNDREFITEYKVLNRADSQDLTARAGDTIHGELTVDSGALSVSVRKEGEAPLYENAARSASETFDLPVEAGGTYTVTVAGMRAAGGVRFEVVPGQGSN